MMSDSPSERLSKMRPLPLMPHRVAPSSNEPKSTPAAGVLRAGFVGARTLEDLLSPGIRSDVDDVLWRSEGSAMDGSKPVRWNDLYSLRPKTSGSTSGSSQGAEYEEIWGRNPGIRPMSGSSSRPVSRASSLPTLMTTGIRSLQKDRRAVPMIFLVSDAYEKELETKHAIKEACAKGKAAAAWRRRSSVGQLRAATSAVLASMRMAGRRSSI